MNEGPKYRRSEVPWLVLGALIGVVFVLPFMPFGGTDLQIVASILCAVGGSAALGVAVGHYRARRRG
jgi:hypothetical protein